MNNSNVDGGGDNSPSKMSSATAPASGEAVAAMAEVDEELTRNKPLHTQPQLSDAAAGRVPTTPRTISGRVPKRPRTSAAGGTATDRGF